MLEKLLKFNPEDRISCPEALKHPFFEKMKREENDSNCGRFNFDFDAKYETLKDIKTEILMEININYHKSNRQIPNSLFANIVVTSEKKEEEEKQSSIFKKIGIKRLFP